MTTALRNGMMVTLKKAYHSNDDEVFKLSQVEDLGEHEQRAWVGDKQGRGWYVASHQISKIVAEEEWDITCENCDGEGYVEIASDGGASIWALCPDCTGDGGFDDEDDDYGYEEQRNFD